MHWTANSAHTCICRLRRHPLAGTTAFQVLITYTNHSELPFEEGSSVNIYVLLPLFQNK